MPAFLPIIAIAAVFVFISTHAASSPKKEKKKSSADELVQALEKVIKESSGAKSDKDK
ncbi:MAG: hypothetical protein WBA76_00545 [Phormidesmis sp.]